MRRGRPERVGEVLKEVLTRPEIKRGLLAGRVLALWPEVAGKELARLTRAEGFKRGVLFVRTRDHVLAHQLAYQRPAILARYAERLGPGVVREVRFKSGPLILEQEKKEEEKRTSFPPAPWVSEAVAGLPPGVKEAAERAGRVIAARLAEADRCPVCQGPREEGELCPNCARLVASPVVAAEAKRLIRGEASRLEGDLAAAARFRAERELFRKLRAESERAVAEPGRVPGVLELALAYLRLTLGREPRPEDLENLPPEVSSLLFSFLGKR